MRVRILQKGAADAALAIAREYGYAELGVVVVAREMGDTNEAQFVVENAEQRVVLEINRLHVGLNRKIALPAAESQPSVVAPERQKMVRNPRPVEA